MNTKLLLLSFILLFSAGKMLMAQPSKADYQRADSTAKFNDKVYNTVSSINWIDSTQTFLYVVKTKRGSEYMLTDAVKNRTQAAFDQEKLCAALNLELKEKQKPYSLNLRKLKLIEEGKKISFELERSVWQCDLKKYKLEKISEVQRERNDRYWGETEEENEERRVESPDKKWEAFVREYNVFIQEKESKKTAQLSFDGSAGDYYSSGIVWSPDSKYFAVNKIRKHEKKFIHFVESSPTKQVQPILQKREYLKPGDALPIKKPALFDAVNRVQIPIHTEAFENQYDLTSPQWCPDSKGFTFEFNQRGHQLYQVVQVDAPSGEVRILAEERSSTFVEYSGKKYRYDLNDTHEMIWASERDGWNHLYLIDTKTGQVKNQITRGEWVVRGVVAVNEKERWIIFKGSGKNGGEDPYFIHYYKINLDGSMLIDLTPVTMENEAMFSFDHSYYTHTFSTVLQSPVTVLRRTSDLQIIDTLAQADITELMDAGWRKPEVFMTKGRDGLTEIWGNIYFPTNFDPSKKYPVIEYIYAGPQSSFVQKSFRPYSYSFTGLCELGFIIVQIDGMGTSNRSKAFHDVCFQNLKDAGFPDRILWMKAAAESRPYMDLERVGIFGGSAGGQNSTGALLFHPDFYKVGVSACGCHDNRMDKMWWNEQWMGYPIGKHYEECSNVENAKNLKGKLMLIVGEVDDNVDPASTLQVADALIKADKEFELVVLPGTGHTLGGKYGERKRRDFFVRHLLQQEAPIWNEQ
jgi:dipeptidyl aminopeptidase/acylaminoacyl peptidase